MFYYGSKDSLSERTSDFKLVLDYAILVQKWLKIVAQTLKKNLNGFGNSFFMGLGQHQQQHPAVHTGGLSRGKDRMWLWLLALVTCDM